MKIIKYIFFVLLIVFVSDISFAQDDVYYTPKNKQKKEKEEKDFNPKKRKINSGYVFIDGKYVEPPYRIKSNRKGVFINGIKITKDAKSHKTNRMEIKNNPGSPKNIAKMDSINKIYLDSVSKYGLNIIQANIIYYYTIYEYDEAIIKIKEFYESLPNIKSVKGKEYLQLIAWNGDKKNIVIGGAGTKHAVYGSNRKKSTQIDEYKSISQRYKTRLEMGDVFFIFVDKERYRGYSETSFSQTAGEKVLVDVFEVLKNDSLSIHRKEKLLKDSVFIGNTMDKYIGILIKTINFDILRKIAEEIDNYSEVYNNRTFGEVESILTLQKGDLINVEISTSPHSNIVNIGCPDPWGASYIGLNPSFYSVTDNIYDRVKDQGYPYVNYFIDETSDDQCTCNLSFESFKHLCAGGIIFWKSHGASNEDGGFIEVAYFNSTEGEIDDLIDYWSNGGTSSTGFGVFQAELTNYNNWGGDTPPFILVAYPEVPHVFWKPDVDINNSIVIVGSCYGYQNGFVPNVGEGGAVFGYNESVATVVSYLNNKLLFRRLNGQVGNNGSYRNTNSAYTSYPFLSFKMYPPDANITLCPATKEYYPEKNAIVSSEVSTGFFETDTWCDATQPAWKALKLEFSNGDLSYNPVNDVYWDNPVDGRSNKIIYEWSGTEGNVKVKVFPQYIIAYGGGGQQLDFDKVCPNGEEGAYSFRVVDAEIEGFTCNFSASPSTSVCSGNTVRFIPYCTNEITSYSWHFEGGNPELTTESNPEIHYGESGLYDVTLHAWNSENEVFSITKNDYIYVYDNDIAYDNPTVSCDYFLYGDAAIKYMVYVDYVPEGYSYNNCLLR